MADAIYAGDGGAFKVCTKCGEAKQLSCFASHPRGLLGRQAACRDCVSSYSRALYEQNREARVAAAREYRKANPDANRRAVKKYKKNNPDVDKEWRDKNRDKARAFSEAWRKKNLHWHREKRAAELRTPSGKLQNAIRAAVYASVKRGTKAGRSALTLVGYTLAELKAHLERKFLPGMSWANYGEWHIDHIVPLSAHNYETPDDADFKRAWALSNLQPLWAKDNLVKGCKVTQGSHAATRGGV